MVKKQNLGRIFQVLTGVLLGLAVVLFVLRWQNRGQGSEAASYFLPDPIPAPEFSLVSHQGERFVSSEFRGTLLAVFFGYTSCPDICPLTLSNLGQAFRDMGEEGERIQLLLITVDPARDTPQRLRDYLSNFHPSFLGLSGTEEEIREVANEFGAFFARTGEGENYTVDHTARTFIIDSSGQIPLTFPVTATPQEMARDLTLLLEEVQ